MIVKTLRPEKLFDVCISCEDGTGKNGPAARNSNALLKRRRSVSYADALICHFYIRQNTPFETVGM